MKACARLYTALDETTKTNEKVVALARRVPSRDKLQALRVFANQASAAIVTSAHLRELRFLADHDPLPPTDAVAGNHARSRRTALRSCQG